MADRPLAMIQPETVAKSLLARTEQRIVDFALLTRALRMRHSSCVLLDAWA